MNYIQELRCPQCSKKIGDIYLDKGRVYCLTGNIMARTFIHNCPVCRRQFHWHAEQLEKQVDKN